MLRKRNAFVEMHGAEFKQAGYRLIDQIADFIDNISRRPVTVNMSSAQLSEIIGHRPLPESGKTATEIVQHAAEILFNYSLLNGHPRFLGYITSSAAPIGALADLLAAAVNPNVGANVLSPVATAIEKQVVKWLGAFIGLPACFDGILVSGGNMANFTAFFAAIHAKIPDSKKEGIPVAVNRPMIYCSRTTHTWIEKAASLSGLGTNSIRWIPADGANRMDITILEQTIREDKKNNLRPIMVIGTAGDVSTGAVDDLKSIASICKRNDCWFHIDGAYGIPAAVVPEQRSLFEGMADADSVALDPHKWLYAPLEAGCTLVKDPNHLIQAYSSHPVYYNFNNDDQPEARNFYEYGLQNSRGFRALKVWMVLQQAGRQGYMEMIATDIKLAGLLFRLASLHAELQAITHNLSITTLRYCPPGYPENNLNELNELLLNHLQRNGEVFLSNAVIGDKYCLRACIVNFRTSEKDIGDIVEIIVRSGREVTEFIKSKQQNSSMNPNKALWEKGDFTRIAESMRESGSALVAQLGITKGLKVLDLGCGDGNTAIPEAKLGADVFGVDIASNLVEAGKMRARTEGLANCTFREGDAADLHELNDHSFDLVVSIFGAMFAPKPFDVAKEMVRVTRPGGRIVMGNWIPGDPTLVAQILKISSAYTPAPPEGFISPMLWGVESHVMERFSNAGVAKEDISFVKDTFNFNAPCTPSEFVDRFSNYYGPTMNAFEAAEKNGKAADLQHELEDLFNRQNISGTGDTTFIPANFLRVTVICR